MGNVSLGCSELVEGKGETRGLRVEGLLLLSLCLVGVSSESVSSSGRLLSTGIGGG